MGEGGKKGGKKGRKNKAGSNLGRSIIRQQFPGPTTPAGDGVLETERGKYKLRSVTQCNDLEELMTHATLAGTDFTARRGEMLVLGSEARHEGERTRAPEGTEVPIPRRPAWRVGMAAAELDERERAAFLEWRRRLAAVEEEQGFLLTPFEKNLEVWRQLWRVVERCELLVQIVDARNPLLFRSVDLERYVGEVGRSKRTLLLVNKADLLSEAQRAAWAAYFEREGVAFAFWSAVAAQEELEARARGRGWRGAGGGGGARAAREGGAREGGADGGGAAAVAEEREGGSEGSEAEEDEEAMLRRMASGARGGGGSRLAALESEMLPSSSDEDDEDGEDGEDDEAEGEADAGVTGEGGPRGVEVDAAGLPVPSTHVLSREEALALLQRVCPEGPLQPDGSRVRTVGLVGYPNVGKSSTVNVLVAEKKTNVSSTPGKTKHFQTLFVPDAPSLVLCDCPGLVFPSVAGSKGQMVCDGILPIDQLRDYVEPMRALLERVPLSSLEAKYTLRLRSQAERDDDPDAPEMAREVLVAHAIARGFMTSTKGAPDEARSARVILKDLVNAKLLHTVPPPTKEGEAAAAQVQLPPAHNPKLPKVPTASGWYDKMREDYEAQEKAGGHFAGGKKHQGAQTTRGMQWRPAGDGAVPDRLVAQGPRVM